MDNAKIVVVQVAERVEDLFRVSLDNVLVQRSKVLVLCVQ